mmetsp:Transcript_1328/g.2826  ORF Transcript_1328/g.2826 Transcript_1328/m.2826 type:complete len:202 (+) Transcript_1328:511-1116(+)
MPVATLHTLFRGCNPRGGIIPLDGVFSICASKVGGCIGAGVSVDGGLVSSGGASGGAVRGAEGVLGFCGEGGATAPACPSLPRACPGSWPCAGAGHRANGWYTLPTLTGTGTATQLGGQRSNVPHPTTLPSATTMPPDGICPGSCSWLRWLLCAAAGAVAAGGAAELGLVVEAVDSSVSCGFTASGVPLGTEATESSSSSH